MSFKSVQFKALKHITCQGVDYEPGQVVPDATSFPNLREMIDWRYLGYATEEEIATYEKEQAEKKKKEQAEKGTGKKE
jgi:hypothetical protein